jgi:hypothetical protein
MKASKLPDGMAYDESLAERVRRLCPKATEKAMFGGRGWMERGNLVVGVRSQGPGEEASLIFRIPPESTNAMLKEPGVRPMIQRGRAMEGWVIVGAAQVQSERALARWIERSRGFAATLPAK